MELVCKKIIRKAKIAYYSEKCENYKHKYEEAMGSNK